MHEAESTEEELNWSLDDILEIDEFDTVYEEVENDLEQYAKFYKRMHPQMSTRSFRRYIKFDEDIAKKLSQLYWLPALTESVDQTDEQAMVLKQRVMDLYLKYADSTRLIEHWLMGKKLPTKQRLGNRNAKRLFSSSPNIEEMLMGYRESAIHTFSPEKEGAIEKKDGILLETITDLRTKIETDFEFRFKPRGKKARIIRSVTEILQFRESPNPAKRKAAQQSLLKKYRDHLTTFFLMYRAVVRNWATEAAERQYESPIAWRNMENEVPDKAVKVLLKVCADNRDIYQRYFRFKAHELGMRRLRRFDISAPLDDQDVEIPFSEAKKLVLDAFGEFSSEFRELAELVFAANAIDSHPSPVKESGAYCAPITPDIVPRVMLNYIPTFDGGTELAHELGHAVQYLKARKNSVHTLDASLPLAETASTFAEMIVFEKLFEKAPNDEVRKSMLARKMDNSYWSIMRQNYFTEFEIRAHEQIPKGITAEELSDIYFETLTEQFGDAVDIDPLFRYEWARVSHFFENPFYCYSYNFGELLSLSLYDRYKKEGDSFVPKIMRILEYGGSKHPETILGEIGIDITSKKFWQKSFDVIRGWQDQLEQF